MKNAYIICINIPFEWGATKEASIYEVTAGGLKYLTKTKVNDFRIQAYLKKKTPYYAVPDHVESKSIKK